MMKRSPVYWTAARSQWFAEPKRLARLGLLASHSEPGITRERTRYSLTEEGLAALRDWLQTPARFTRMQNEAAIRLLAGDLVENETIVQSLRGLVPEVEALLASLDASEEIARGLPHRTPYLLLSHRLARKLLVAHLEWVHEVERELAPGRRPGRT
jgi:DNA-binding PadR family transcriptional regulator